MSGATARKSIAIEDLLKKPVFKAEEARELGVSTSLLQDYVKTGVLRRVGSGFYVGSVRVPAIDLQWEALIDSVLSTPGGVIC